MSTSPERSSITVPELDDFDLAEFEILFKKDHAKKKKEMRRQEITPYLMFRFLLKHINVDRDIDPICDPNALRDLTHALTSYVRMDRNGAYIFPKKRGEDVEQWRKELKEKGIREFYKGFY